MNPFWTNIVSQTILKPQSGSKLDTNYSDFKKAKAYRAFWIRCKQTIRNSLFIAIGIFSASFGLKSFLLKSNLIDGGATGISLLLAEVLQVPLFILIPAVNIPFIWMGYKIMGKRFALKTILSISLLALAVAVINFPNVTSDLLLVSVFGGFFLGAGIGFTMRGGAVIDGTDILAIYLSKKLGATIGDVIMFFNVIVFGFAAYLLSIEQAMYSMLAYLAATKTLDFLIEGIDEYIGVTIISVHNEQIRNMISETMGRGVTIYKDNFGYGKSGLKKQVTVLYTVITRLELNKLKSEIEKIDTSAFVVMHSVKDTRGGMIKKRSMIH